MGTGFGCGLLLFNDGFHKVLPLETGHTTITTLGKNHKDKKEEEELFDYIGAKLYNNQNTIEFEDVCSGRGLGYCYEFVTKDDASVEKNITAQEIVSKALCENPDPYASKALLWHYKYLFRSAQTQCVGLQAKGVFLAGDNQVYNNSFVTKHTNTFKEEFLNHTKRKWIEEIPFYQQTKKYNLNLHGTLFVARRNANRK